VIEQSIGWLKEYRRIATRYEKLALSFLAMLNWLALSIILKDTLLNLLSLTGQKVKRKQLP
jgi:hypothetical protein